VQPEEEVTHVMIN